MKFPKKLCSAIGILSVAMSTFAGISASAAASDYISYVQSAESTATKIIIEARAGSAVKGKTVTAMTSILNFANQADYILSGTVKAGSIPIDETTTYNSNTKTFGVNYANTTGVTAGDLLYTMTINLKEPVTGTIDDNNTVSFNNNALNDFTASTRRLTFTVDGVGSGNQSGSFTYKAPTSTYTSSIEAGKQLVVLSQNLNGEDLTKDSKIAITYGDETRESAETIFELIGIEGEGTATARTINVNVKTADTNSADGFSFEIK